MLACGITTSMSENNITMQVRTPNITHSLLLCNVRQNEICTLQPGGGAKFLYTAQNVTFTFWTLYKMSEWSFIIVWGNFKITTIFNNCSLNYKRQYSRVYNLKFTLFSQGQSVLNLTQDYLPLFTPRPSWTPKQNASLAPLLKMISCCSTTRTTSNCYIDSPPSIITVTRPP